MGELVFFDVETTMPTGTESRCWMLEFGAILVCPRKLVEIGSYCTLIRPADLSVVPPHRLSGITREAVSSAPPFEDVADQIYKIMNGRVWVGHNIRRFDCVRLKEAFADIGRPSPEPIGMIDSLNVLSQGFGRRAGDLKMATLASYFKIGPQKHRSIDDARMNLEVIKHCATVLFLVHVYLKFITYKLNNTLAASICNVFYFYLQESSLPNVLSNNNNIGMVTRSKASTTLSCRQEIRRKSPPTCTAVSHRTSPYNTRSLGKVVEKAKDAIRGARGSRTLNTLVRHSRYLLR
ncbi:Ribonuclease H superfamily polynucleotidyl transferase [Rhynchospora pubera]|uniref:Ribonuclease H superfamily polynucleotidyl transferase n=1 Tax=Rhynchospora pubera TaxID=906938 RepID=A0AAV8GUQ1_9POAL|nr:Ribonuclease H superfamily polynucleotidyl transferase [Rhynchospora pubera]